MELYTDTYYIQRIQAGDTACFACLLDKYSRPVHSLILKVVRNREDAEELAQDVFMKVFKHLSLKFKQVLQVERSRIGLTLAIRN